MPTDSSEGAPTRRATILAKLVAISRHRQGAPRLAVAVRREGDGLRAVVTLPEGMTGTLAWHGATRLLRAGRQELLP